MQPCKVCGTAFAMSQGSTVTEYCSFKCLDIGAHIKKGIDMNEDQKKFAREMIEAVNRIAEIQEKQMKLALTLSKALLAFARQQKRQSAEDRLMDEVESVLAGVE